MTAFISWVALGAAVSAAPDVPTLTVTATAATISEQDVLASVLAFHPNLEAALERRRAGEAQLLAARGGFDPQVSVDAQTVPTGYYDYRYLDVGVAQPTALWGVEATGGYRIGLPDQIPSFAPYNEDLETLDGGELRVGLKAPLWRGGPIDKRRAAIRKNVFGVDRLDAEVRVARLDLARGAISAYWDWRAAVEKLRVAQQLRSIARARDEAVGRRVAEGSLAPIERVEATRALRTREQEVVTAEQKVQLTALKLSLFLRDINGEPFVPGLQAASSLSSAVMDIDDERRLDGRDRALSARPEMDALEQKLSELGVEVDLASNSVFPKVDFKANLSRDFGDAREAGRTAELEPTELKLGVTLELPALLRESRGELAAARARRAELQQKIRFTRDKLVAEVESAWVVLETSTRNAQIAVELRELAERVAAGERRRFEEGSTDLFTVFLRENSVAEAASKAIDALATQRAADTIYELTTCRGGPAFEAVGLPAC